MGVSALGSAFSYIPPERVARSEPSRSRENATAETVPSTQTGSGSSTGEPVAGASKPADRLAPDTRSSLITEQETSGSEDKPVTHQAAARAYGSSAA